MALPSGFTLASAAALVAAGVWLATSASGTDDGAEGSNGSARPASHAPPSHRGGTQEHRNVQQKPQRRRDVVPKVLVEVFNNSSVSGLAGRVAAQAAHVGWQVVGSDNWYGTIPASTVYYPPRLAKAAHQLSLDLGIRRRMPAVSPMRLDRLTVILTGPVAPAH